MPLHLTALSASRSRAARVLLVLLAAVMAVAGAVVPLAQAQAAVEPSVQVRGNVLVDRDNAVIRLLGVNYSGTEYACRQGWGIFDGPNDLASVRAMQSWGVNTVRIPMNQDCWLGINGVDPAVGGAAYRAALSEYVALLGSQGLYAVLELHWSAPGTSPATGQNPMPDASHSPDFWRSVSTTFRNRPGVLFDLFNEPFPDGNQDTTAAWTCWRDGGRCTGISYEVAGMQSLVDAVRSTGATNVLLVGGVRYANSLSKWLTYRPVDPLGQVVAAAHVYGNNACGAQNGGACLDREVAPVAARVPVVFGETGETYDNSECTSRNSEVVLPWADAHGVSYLAWVWNTWGTCGALISDFDGTPNTSTPPGARYATYVRDHLLRQGAQAPTGGATRAARPVGALDEVRIAPGGLRARGWTLDPDTSDPIGVHVYAAGRVVPGRADLSRPDVGAALGKGDAHGYDTFVPAGGGTHSVCAYGINDGPGYDNTTLGCRSLSVPANPVGAFDSLERVPGGVRARGWSIDPAKAGAVTVHGYVNGAPGALTAGTSRPDVGRVFPEFGAAHGVDAVLPSPGSGVQRVCLYAIGGTNPNLGCRDVTVTHEPYGRFDGLSRTASGVRVAGWATDPDTIAPVVIEVLADGVSIGTVTASGLRPDVARAFPAYGSARGFSADLVAQPGTQQVCLLARDSSGGPVTSLGCRSTT